MVWRGGRSIGHTVAFLAGKNAQIETQDRQIADYKQKLDGASPDQAKKRIEDLGKQVSALAKHIDPRSVKTDQEKVLAQI
jgi:hypothetical protein